MPDDHDRSNTPQSAAWCARHNVLHCSCRETGRPAAPERKRLQLNATPDYELLAKINALLAAEDTEAAAYAGWKLVADRVTEIVTTPTTSPPAAITQDQRDQLAAVILTAGHRLAKGHAFISQDFIAIAGLILPLLQHLGFLSGGGVGGIDAPIIVWADGSTTPKDPQ